MYLTGGSASLRLLRSPNEVALPLAGALTNVVDFITSLLWIPTSIQSRGRRLHGEIVEVHGGMIDRVKARMDAGEDVPDCLVKTLILTQAEEKLDCVCYRWHSPSAASIR